MSTPSIDYREQLLKEISGLSQQDLEKIYQVVALLKAQFIAPDESREDTSGWIQAEQKATEAYARGDLRFRTVREMAEHTPSADDFGSGNHPHTLICEIELLPDEKLTLPESLVNRVSAGRWTITLRPQATFPEPIRNHNAFLAGYAPADEGLYDNDPPR